MDFDSPWEEKLTMPGNKINYLDFLVCPECKGRLAVQKTRLFCRQCQIKYPVRDGIPDFRCRFSAQDAFSLKYFSHHSVMTEDDYCLEEWHKSFLRRFSETFPAVKNKVICDGGVGQGYMTIELAKKGAIIIACDLVFEALVRLKEIARKQGLEKKILFVCCSLEKLPIKSRVVDYGVLNAVLEHLDYEEKAIREFDRVGRTNSGLMITVPLLLRYLNPLFIPSCIWQDRMIGHKRRYDEVSLLQRLAKYRFKIKKIYYSGHFRKVIFTKFFLPVIRSRGLIKKFEAFDQQEENRKKGASNVCVMFER